MDLCVFAMSILKSGVLFSNAQPNQKILYTLSRLGSSDLAFLLWSVTNPWLTSPLAYSSASMKLCVHINVLLLALGVISGQKCNASNECDSNSHLHVATKTTKVTKTKTSTIHDRRIREFQLNAGLVELSGFQNSLTSDPGTPGCLWILDVDSDVVTFTQTIGISNFDIQGLATVAGFPTPPPTFGLFYTPNCPALGQSLQADPAAMFGTVGGDYYDYILVPGSAASVPNLTSLQTAIDFNVGVVMSWIGSPASRVFRQGANGPWYQEDNDGNIFGANGTLVVPGGSGVTGDPHIHTLDGGHYTLLREGSFLLWRFGLPQPHVEWQIFAHYAGRQSFTKALLLVDTSGPEPSGMEITSERCEWHTQSSSKKWSSVNSTAPEVLLSGPSSHMKLVGNQRKDMQKIDLFIADEKVPDVPVATLKVLCRPGRHINLKLHMGNEKWKSSVSGELKGQKGPKHIPTSKRSMLQLATREDEEFEVKQTWAELGGSSHAQHYLQNFDEHPTNVMLSQTCDHQAQADARVLCQKHLGTVARSSYFEECVYDVCAGGGEEAAEMTAEMLKFWAAPAGKWARKAEVVARLSFKLSKHLTARLPLLLAKSVWSMHRIASMADGYAQHLTHGVLPDQSFSFLWTLFLIYLGSFFDISSCLILYGDLPTHTSHVTQLSAALHRSVVQESLLSRRALVRTGLNFILDTDISNGQAIKG